MIGVQLQPVDTWFFRDGTPFTMGSAPQEDVGSLFPPHPPTVIGALRMALALGKGWNGRGQWPREYCDVLGDGPDNLGALSVDGPFLLRDGKPLFRTPRHLLGSTDGARWNPSVFLRPGDPVTCDLGTMRLPEPTRTLADIENPKTGDRFWLTQDGMKAALRGRLPCGDDVVPSQSLWSDEPRIGLERDIGTRTAREGRLYSTRHVRPRCGVSLGVRIAGLPQGWEPPFDRLLSLGGENRLAECREWKEDLSFGADVPKIKAARKVMMVALSALDLEQEICLGCMPLNALGNARVVSACLDRPQRVGGWNSLARCPLPMRSVLPPGSVLFCEISDSERFEAAVAGGDGLAHIGRRQEWGFGLVALGVWPDAQ